MKVLYILHSTFEGAGSTKSFLAMLEGLMGKGVDVQVVVPDRNGIFNTLKNNHVTTCVLNYRSHVYPKFDSFTNALLFLPRLFLRLFLNRMAVSKLKKIVGNQHFDIIHTNVSVVNIGYVVARKMGLKHVYHVREYGDLDFGFVYYPCRKKLLNQLNGGGSYSVCITKDIQNHYGLINSKLSRVIYNGIIEKKDSDKLPDKDFDKRFFLYAGRIEEAKGVLDLIEAYLEYSKDNNSPLPLYLAGEINDKSYYNKILTKLHNNNLSKSVTFLGQVDNLDELMSKAWAIVIPSLNEGFGRCMAEAMSNGCLVVGRNTGGTKEQFDNGLKLTGEEIGFRFENVDELAKQMMMIGQMNVNDRGVYVNRAFHVVNQLYTSDNNVNEIYMFYEDILAS